MSTGIANEAALCPQNMYPQSETSSEAVAMQAAMTQHQQLTQFASEEHLAGEKKEAAEFKRPMLIDRQTLNYRYGILPATHISPPPTSTDTKTNFRHMRYRVDEALLESLSNVPLKDTSSIEDIFFGMHKPTQKTLATKHIDPEPLRQPLAFERAVDAIRADCEPPLFDARMKAFEFQYFRWLYHAGLCITPPNTLTPLDVDRLNTAGFVDDDEFDFVPALTLLALGAYRRSQLNAMFWRKETSAVPVRMRWTIGPDERPSISEVRIYIKRQEDKLAEKANADGSMNAVRPQITEEWEQYHKKKHGIYGLKQLGVSDDEAADLIYTKDFTFVDPRRPLNEPSNLTSFGTRPIPRAPIVIQQAYTSLPTNFNFVPERFRKPEDKSSPPTAVSSHCPSTGQSDGDEQPTVSPALDESINLDGTLRDARTIEDAGYANESGTEGGLEHLDDDDKSKANGPSSAPMPGEIYQVEVLAQKEEPQNDLEQKSLLAFLTQDAGTDCTPADNTSIEEDRQASSTAHKLEKGEIQQPQKQYDLILELARDIPSCSKDSSRTTSELENKGSVHELDEGGSESIEDATYEPLSNSVIECMDASPVKGSSQATEESSILSIDRSHIASSTNGQSILVDDASTENHGSEQSPTQVADEAMEKLGTSGVEERSSPVDFTALDKQEMEEQRIHPPVRARRCSERIRTRREPIDAKLLPSDHSTVNDSVNISSVKNQSKRKRATAADTVQANADASNARKKRKSLTLDSIALPGSQKSTVTAPSQIADAATSRETDGTKKSTMMTEQASDNIDLDPKERTTLSAMKKRQSKRNHGTESEPATVEADALSRRKSSKAAALVPTSLDNALEYQQERGKAATTSTQHEPSPSTIGRRSSRIANKKEPVPEAADIDILSVVKPRGKERARTKKSSHVTNGNAPVAEESMPVGKAQWRKRARRNNPALSDSMETRRKPETSASSQRSAGRRNETIEETEPPQTRYPLRQRRTRGKA